MNDTERMRVFFYVGCVSLYLIEAFLTWGNINNGKYGIAAFNFMIALIPLFSLHSMMIGNYFKK
jgi:uncharacterized membrane protein YtjA (UPF0391 family)